MNDNIANLDMCKDFQDQVSQVLIRHKSILDIMTKLDEYNARINRAVAKSVTTCGCISIDASKQDFGNGSFQDMLNTVESHIEGKVCNNCKEVISEEIGSYIFYLSALSNSLGLDLSSILKDEYNTIKTLGIYTLK
ncbi:MAG: DUF1573 domain-containing protein [Tissierellaceae bacterium]|nr:DUF1573 domain-containing protein [Tissierellaceae bacterium]